VDVERTYTRDDATICGRFHVAGTLSINGKKVASGRLERTIPFIYGTETADVGIDLYTAVTTDYPKGENQFTGTIDKVTVDVK
jgi:arylsulfatase